MAATTFSVVIPAYNEEEYIEECILRLIEQGSNIDEIVVVDNNSTDGTADIVKRLAADDARIRLITESRQGVVYARSAGFDSARGDIIARVDAETLVGEGWTEALLGFFASEAGADYDVVSTLGEFRGMPGWRFQAALNGWNDPFGEYRDRPQAIDYCFGASMAIRRTAWSRIRSAVTMRRDIFEDIDIALCIIDAGGTCALLRNVVVEVSPRRFYTGIANYSVYASYVPRTYWLHRRWWKAGALVAGLPVTVAFHAARLVVLRGYGEEGNPFSLTGVFDRTPAERVRP